MHSVCVIVYVSVLIYVMYICNRLRHYMHVLVLSLSLSPSCFSILYYTESDSDLHSA